jgi:hypothetical protein
MLEIATACAKTDAPNEFLAKLALCTWIAEDEFLLVLSGPLDLADDESIAHNVGTALSKSVTCNVWDHSVGPMMRHSCHVESADSPPRVSADDLRALSRG